MDAAAIRRQREEMRKQWMAQRAVEKDREAVLSQMGVAPPPQQDYIPSCFEDKPPSRDGSSVASSAMMHPSQAGEVRAAAAIMSCTAHCLRSACAMNSAQCTVGNSFPSPCPQYAVNCGGGWVVVTHAARADDHADD